MSLLRVDSIICDPLNAKEQSGSANRFVLNSIPVNTIVALKSTNITLEAVSGLRLLMPVC